MRPSAYRADVFFSLVSIAERKVLSAPASLPARELRLPQRNQNLVPLRTSAQSLLEPPRRLVESAAFKREPRFLKPVGAEVEGHAGSEHQPQGQFDGARTRLLAGELAEVRVSNVGDQTA